MAACNYGLVNPQAVPDDAGPSGGDGAVVSVPDSTCAVACHGDAESEAPPSDTQGNSDVTARGVGAHRVHLATTDWYRQIECSDCHLVPVDLASEGHIDTALPAELVTTGFFENSTWDGTTCADTYCHGSTLTGGTLTEPAWTSIDGNTDDCGSCHGAPPPAPHPADTDCGLCHQNMNPGEYPVIAFPALHIDGKLDVIDNTECDSCHGSGGNSAPPSDTEGNTATSARGVGAHRAHLGSSDWHALVDCTDCHRVPVGLTDLGHVDSDLPAELTFSARAGAASWDGSRCSNSYCHGGTLTGGTATSPQWTLVDGSQTDCDSCHGAPPPPPHPVGSDCASCHQTMVAGQGMTIAYPNQHIDGKVDIIDDQPCDSCHGSDGVNAPPVDTSGNTDTSARGVGAHRRHVDASTWRAPIPCDACHRVPEATYEIGHVDSDLPAELIFAAPAQATTWNGTRCTNAYCHGAPLSGGTTTAPNWTQTDGAQTQCGSCHGLPPPAPHPANPDCGVCHQTMTAGQPDVITDPDRHVNGAVELIDDPPCDSCHGNAGDPAPPRDTGNRTATTARGVGAHQSHLGTSNWHKEVVCQECHRVPTAVGAVGHNDTPLPAELTFGPLAGGSTSWNGARCSNNYCHGSSLSGGSATSPQWTLVDGSQSQCDSCHGAPPPPPHTASGDCGLCHDTMTSGQGLTISDPSRHIDGNLDVDDNVACDSCHGSGGESAPPVDVGGSSSTGNRGVGAHRSHLGSSSWHAEVVCGNCHRVPTAVGSQGHEDTPLPAELIFTGLGSGTSWNGARCTSYCHGSTTAGGTVAQPQWTLVNGSQTQCDSCHGSPPPPPHPANTQCDSCHGAVVGPGPTITTPALHIDGTLQVDSVHPEGWGDGDQHGYAFNQDGPADCATSSCHGTALSGGDSNVSCNDCHSGWQTDCTFCHGGNDNNTGAPPASVYGITSPSNRAVGAHTVHVEPSSMHVAWDCGKCHVKPSSALSPNHIDGTPGAEVVFSSPNSSASYTGTTCSNLYCHGNGRGNNGSATWTSTTNLDCGSCHQGPTGDGSNLSGKHEKHVRSENMDCFECHMDVVNASGNIISAQRHVNGSHEIRMEVGGSWNASTRTCSGLPSGPCHGSKRW